MGLPDLRSKKKGKQKVSKDSHVSEALDKLREQTMEAVKGLESVTGAKPGGGDDLGSDAMMEDWVKQFEELTGSQVMCLKLFVNFPFKLRQFLTYLVDCLIETCGLTYEPITNSYRDTIVLFSPICCE